MQHAVAFESLVNEVRPHIKECSVEQVYARLQNNEKFILIDVREDHEWEESHIPNAIHVGRGILERDIANVTNDKNSEVVLYCGGGFRSALSAYNLQKMGYTNVWSMASGISGWKERNFPCIL